jgi:hypothetical protein
LASTQDSAMKRFLIEVENDYDSLVGFKTKLNDLKNDCSKLNEEGIGRLEKPYHPLAIKYHHYFGKG